RELLQPDDGARPHVAIVRDGHLELELLVAGVGHVAAQIPVHARGAEGWPGDAESDAVLGAEMPYPFEAADPDGVAGKQILVFVDLLGKDLDELLNAIEEIERRLEGQASDAEVGGHHALPGDGLEDAEDFFTLAEGVEEDGERADVHGV